MANGKLRLGTDVVLVENGQYLAPNAANFWRLMKAAAARDGVNLSINEGYRTYERQVYYRNLYLSGQGNPAGIPGTSKHGLGLAVDVFLNPGVFEWLTKNAATYGFTWTQGRADDEKWHWVFDGTPRIAFLPPTPIGDTEMLPYKLFYFNGTKTQPKEWVLVSTTDLPNGSDTTTDVFRAEVWQNFTGGKGERVSTYARFQRIVAESARLAALAG